MKKQGKYIWTAKVSDKGQLVIPKQAREVFNINEGDTLVIFGDINKGLAIVKSDDCVEMANDVFGVGESGDDRD